MVKFQSMIQMVEQRFAERSAPHQYNLYPISQHEDASSADIPDIEESKEWRIDQHVPRQLKATMLLNSA